MANRSVLEILLKVKDQATQGVNKFKASLGGISSLLGGLGLAIGAKEAFDFARAAEEDARALTDARNRLVQTIGSVEEYNNLIRTAQASTRNMVDEATLASGAFVLLEQNLATNAEEAARLSNAGNVLSKAFESQGASVELFNRLLANGSRVLLDNFGISQTQVQVRQEQIEATTRLSSEEARLQAIREISIEKAERLASTMSDATVQQEQLNAATKDFSAAFGELLLPSLEQGRGALTGFLQDLTTGARAWKQVFQDIATIQDINAQVADKLGVSTNKLREQRRQGIITEDQYQKALAEVNAETQKTQAAEKERATFMGYYADRVAYFTQIQNELNESLGQSQRAIDASSARLTGMADAYNRMYGAGTADFTRTTPDEAIRKQEEAVEDLGDSIITSVGGAFDEVGSKIESSLSSALGRIQEVMPDLLGGGGEDPGEFGRRLGALADGLQDSDKIFLEKFKEQAGGNPVFAGLLQSIEEGDSAGVAAEANRLLQENIPNVVAVGLADQIKEQMRQQNILAQAKQIVAEELGEVPPVLQDVSTGFSDIETGSQAATEKSTEGIQTTTEFVMELNKHLERTAGLFTAAGDAAKRMGDQAANSGFYSNSPAGGPATDAQMGGDGRL